ncbi:hypothetical protein CC85DRAFT_331410 [Cutaneotrichosporon oleaginosum]|uniref:Uncharacterized protein n=1 Tax=Cutaneotrichosporon oleaginosum TaxID=879819 RepID=A0A0J0XC83_9TREE|nr:uncharacterized protein CC85DRAFT_331410 [Cutaneotrichosporon oleaginosum]KLT38675.1 hypothetical protein CC85DRAFT_331410 [Cutaneotrichosporon oleaginosum]TXT12278.1 hypothetical protein COLE_02688 [Cutaneotrichosporon oleaginosum]
MFAAFYPEIYRLIGEHLDDPLDRLKRTWLDYGTTLSTSPLLVISERNEDASLRAFARICRKVYAAVRPLLFRKIYIHTIAMAERVLRADWAVHVVVLQLSMQMFNGVLVQGERHRYRKRSCWEESALLVRVLRALPNLAHFVLFSGVTDETTLALLFAELIPRDGALGSSSHAATTFPSRLRSLQWSPLSYHWPEERTFPSTLDFASLHHLLTHADNLDTLLLGADDELRSFDVLEAYRHLSHPVRLIVSSEISEDSGGWRELVPALAKQGLKELAMHRLPEECSDLGTAMALLAPLAESGSTALDIGWFPFETKAEGKAIVDILPYVLAKMISTLCTIGVWGSLGWIRWDVSRLKSDSGHEQIELEIVRDDWVKSDKSLQHKDTHLA